MLKTSFQMLTSYHVKHSMSAKKKSYSVTIKTALEDMCNNEKLKKSTNSDNLFVGELIPLLSRECLQCC